MIQRLHEPSAVAAEPRRGAFSTETVEELQSADWTAAAMVAGLMVSIFTTGVIIYIIVAASAFSGSS